MKRTKKKEKERTRRQETTCGVFFSFIVGLHQGETDTGKFKGTSFSAKKREVRRVKERERVFLFLGLHRFQLHKQNHHQRTEREEKIIKVKMERDSAYLLDGWRGPSSKRLEVSKRLPIIIMSIPAHWYFSFSSKCANWEKVLTREDKKSHQSTSP
jgi:hypothetical protein